MDNDHGITGGLRQYASYAATDRFRQSMLDIADRIDSAHEKALHEAYTKGYEDGVGVANAKDAQAEYLRGKNDGYDEGWDAGFASADDWLAQHEDAMAEHGWYRALDADKQPIKLGDEVYQVEGGLVYTVESITFYPDNTTVSFGCKHGFGCDNAHNVHHYHAPTVEDVLRGVVTLCYNTWKEESPFHFCDVDDVMKSGNIADFAAKLRLAGDAE